MTVNGLLKKFPEGIYFEIYRRKDATYHPRNPFHGDYIQFVENAGLSSEVETWELMNEEDYRKSICANSSDEVNFEEWYSDKDARVLCILIKSE